MEKKKGYKGFKKGLICDPTGKNPFQYAENTTFEESDAKICNCGLHFCENPFDVLEHYGFVGNNGTLNEFAEVEALDECLTDNNKKFVTKKLHIGARLSIAGLVQAFVNFTFGRVDWKNDAATNTGYRSAATNTGYQSAATNTGNRSAATNTGDQSAATNTGDQSAATNTGYRSAAAVEGRESFAIATGIDGMAKGSLGCYIAVAEYEETEDGYRLVDFKSHIVDGETIKADTFYMLKNGEFVEVE